MSASLRIPVKMIGDSALIVIAFPSRLRW